MELDVESKSPLNWEVFVTPGILVATSDVPPGQTQRMFSSISSTLIYGKHDTVLVDFLVRRSNGMPTTSRGRCPRRLVIIAVAISIIIISITFIIPMIPFQTTNWSPYTAWGALYRTGRLIPTC